MTASPLSRALAEIQRFHKDNHPLVYKACHSIKEYLRFWELAKLDSLLFPTTSGPASTVTTILDRAPAALPQARFEEQAAAVKPRFVQPFSMLFPVFEEWAERFLESNGPLLERYPIGPGYTTEDRRAGAAADLLGTHPGSLRISGEAAPSALIT